MIFLTNMTLEYISSKVQTEAGFFTLLIAITAYTWIWKENWK